MTQSNDTKACLHRNTRVLFRNKRNQTYVMTNDTGSEQDLLRVFFADIHGKITAEGFLLGSLFAHDPYIIPDLEKLSCSFSALNPGYFVADPVVDGLLGQAAGDAFGVPVEFMERSAVRELGLKDMVGKDTPLTFSSRWGNLIPAGAWSDDTSMTIAAMASVIQHGGVIDHDDVMKQFLAWWDEGMYSSLSFPFGLGNNISHAMARYRRGTPALACGGKDLMDNGNGALMRIFPFAMYCIRKNLPQDEALSVIRNAAGLTHGHEINAMSCFIYTLFLDECLRTRNPEKAYRNALPGNTAFFRRTFSEETVEAHADLFQLNRSSFDPERRHTRNEEKPDSL